MLSLIFSIWALLISAVLCGVFLVLMQPGASPLLPYALVTSVVVTSMVVALPNLASYPLWVLAALWAAVLLLLYRLPLPHWQEGDDDVDELIAAYQGDPEDITRLFDFEEIN